MSERPDTGEILRSLRLLRSPSAEERKQGIEILSGLADDPRVLQVFEYLYQIDPDPEVRDMAWQAIIWQGPSVPAPGPEPEERGERLAAARANGNERRLFLMNPSNARLVAEHTRRAAAASQKRGRVPAFIATVLLFIAGIFWGLVLPDWRTWYQFDQEAVTTQGEIIALEIREQVPDDARYVVYYHFATGSAEEEVFFSGEQRVSPDFYEAQAEDTPVDVTYLPDDPDQSRLDDHHNPAVERRNDRTIAAGGLTFIFLLLFVLSAIQRRRPEQAVRGKHLIRGDVVSSTGLKDDDGDFNVKLRYSFQSPNGQIITDQTSQIRNDLSKTSLPAPGTPVAVYYQNDHSYRLL
jgi:hypothetical protein